MDAGRAGRAPGAGTTWAAWEAVAGLLAEWPLEYPRTAAALAARLEAGIPAGTVLWLGELGRYADADGGADALDRLDDLFDEDGYLVVATIWPWQWDACIAAVGAGRGAGDPAWLAGRMLARLDELSLYDPSSISPDYGGGFVDVPARFTAAELAEAAGSGDLVLALLRALGTARAGGAVRALVARDPARHADPDDLRETALLITAMHAAGPEASDATRALAEWAAGHCVIDGAQNVASLLHAMRAAGQDGAVRRLLDRDPVGQGRFNDPWEAAALLAELREAGEDGAGRRLLDRDPARLGKIDFADSVAWLLTELREAGAGEAIRTLLARDPASHVDLNDPQAIAWLVAELAVAGDVQAIRTLATRVAGPGGFDDLAYLTRWLEHFRAAGDEGLRALLPADRARHAALGPAGDMAWLLEHLVAAGASDLARALLGRDPGGQAGLDDLRDVARLIAALRAAGAGEAAGILAMRAAGAGMFGVFLAYHSDGRDTGGAVSYRHGCEPDLTPAPPWRWTPPDPPAAESGPAR